jgi:hypothetical protein
MLSLRVSPRMASRRRGGLDRLSSVAGGGGEGAGELSRRPSRPRGGRLARIPGGSTLFGST